MSDLMRKKVREKRGVGVGGEAEEHMMEVMVKTMPCALFGRLFYSARE